MARKSNSRLARTRHQTSKRSRAEQRVERVLSAA